MCKKILIMQSIIISIPTLVFAQDNSYNALAEISNIFLSVLQWAGYAIALIVLILLGIKYMFSPANEKANLKGKLVTYAYGVALIVLCSTIAGAVAKVANADGKNTAEGIVQEGIDKSGVQEIEGAQKLEEEDTWPKVENVRDEYGRIIGAITRYEDGSYSEAEYTDKWGYVKGNETYYDKDGNVIRYEEFRKNGELNKVTYYGANGEPSKERKYEEDGTYVESRFVSSEPTLSNVVNDELLEEFFPNLELKYVDTGEDGKIDTVEFYDSEGVLVYKGRCSYEDNEKTFGASIYMDKLNVYEGTGTVKYVTISKNEGNAKISLCRPVTSDMSDIITSYEVILGEDGNVSKMIKTTGNNDKEEGTIEYIIPE